MHVYKTYYLLLYSTISGEVVVIEICLWPVHNGVFETSSSDPKTDRHLAGDPGGNWGIPRCDPAGPGPGPGPPGLGPARTPRPHRRPAWSPRRLARRLQRRCARMPLWSGAAGPLEVTIDGPSIRRSAGRTTTHTWCFLGGMLWMAHLCWPCCNWSVASTTAPPIPPIWAISERRPRGGSAYGSVSR